MSYQLKYYAFGPGFGQDQDDRLLEPGRPRALENLVLVKGGALGMRLDYDSLGVTVPSGNGVKLFDVAEFNGRLVGFGCVTAGSRPIDIYEYVNQTGFAWRPSDPNELPRLCTVTAVRNMGRLPAQQADTLRSRVAAGGGLVAMVTQRSSAVTVHIFDPVTDATVLVQTLSSRVSPQVVAVGSVFFITTIASSGATQVFLQRYNPATDTALVSLTAAFTDAGGVGNHDLQTNEAGTGFWLAVNTSTDISLRLFNSSGTATQTITGPLIAGTHLAVFGQSARVHLLVAEAADLHVDLYTYELAGGTLENTSLDLAGGIATDLQPGMCVAGSGTNLCVVISEDLAGSTRTNIAMLSIAPSTHVAGSVRRWYDTRLNSKPLQAGGTEIFAGISVTEDPASTAIGRTGCNYLGVIGISQTSATEMVAAYTDRPNLATHATVAGVLSTGGLATDSSTGKSYWCRHVRNEDFTQSPAVSEFVAGSTARRQTAVVADLLYIASGAMQCFDGRQLTEAQMQERPRIISAAGTSGGSKSGGAIKQLVPVWETYDARQRKISSTIGAVKEVTLGGSDTAIAVVPSTPHSSRQNATSSSYGSGIRTVIYETLDTRGGELTLHRSGSALNDTNFGEPESVTLTFSDTFLETTGIIYTQADRGALSGPLPFDAPEPCSTLCASADTILSGGCPEGSRVQESRPQFIAEQLNWSDEIGFQRECRGDVLAVSRLDERRLIRTATEIFQMDGPGIDDVGDGDLGAPRRLPSDVGIYGGRQAWQSIVEFGGGEFFQGKSDMLYLLPRGGSTPQPVGVKVQTLLASYPSITSATYIAETETVRFTCNNSATAPTDAIVLVYDVVANEWYSEGPFGTAISAGTRHQGRAIIVRSGVAYRQRLTHPPAAFISNAWRSGVLHPFGPGNEGQVFGVHFFGTVRGNCQVACTVRFDGGSTSENGATETIAAQSVSGLTAGTFIDLRFGLDQTKCSSIMVDFAVTALAGAATAGVEYNFFALEQRAIGKAKLHGSTRLV